MRYINIDELLNKRNEWKNCCELWKNKELKKAFVDFFFNKCWYTEVKLLGQDPHIDHFRPKGKITKYESYFFNEPIKENGYYWLANDPENYRVCCVYANRKTGEGGKGTFFPLADDSELMTPNGTEVEKPLLIDPCNKTEVSLITFMGNNVLASSLDVYDQMRVTVSKKIYNMEDPCIKTERNKVWVEVEKTLEEYKTENITREVCLRRLKELVDPAAQFSACAIACVNSYADDDLKNELNLDL